MAVEPGPDAPLFADEPGHEEAAPAGERRVRVIVRLRQVAAREPVAVVHAQNLVARSPPALSAPACRPARQTSGTAIGLRAVTRSATTARVPSTTARVLSTTACALNDGSSASTAVVATDDSSSAGASLDRTESPVNHPGRITVPRQGRSLVISGTSPARFDLTP
jgi:hypothetical protein